VKINSNFEICQNKNVLSKNDINAEMSQGSFQCYCVVASYCLAHSAFTSTKQLPVHIVSQKTGF